MTRLSATPPGACGITPGGCAGAGHQSERPDALGVVDADDGLGRKIVRPQPELPDDIAGRGGLDDPVVELVGNQDVARLVEMAV